MQAGIKQINGTVHSVKHQSFTTNNTNDSNKIETSDTMALRLASLSNSLIISQTAANTHHNSLSKRMKTEAVASSSDTTISSVSNSAQTFITRHCSSLIRTSSSNLLSAQSKLENRLKSSLRKLRQQQLTLSHSHSLSQVSEHKTNSVLSTSLLLSQSPATDGTSSLNSTGDSNDSMVSTSFHPPLPSNGSGGDVKEVSTALRHHLKFLETFVDDEATCSSSDEEEEDEEKRKGKRRESFHRNRSEARYDKCTYLYL